MFLKSIVINGFKSFALRRELLVHEGITGIVGPNGSGKSNIADAIRWVLGEQSSRNLRGTSMQEVIFKGTQTRPAKSSCEVSLLFDNSDHHFDVAYSEVVVKRRLYRNGDSEYSINGTNCRLKDIVALFRDTGLGRDGYSIIGQGRINRILDSRAAERRLVFDEAAGIMKYRSRKEEAERNLRRTRENVARVEDIIAELRGQLEPLKAQVRAAREHRELQAELRRTEVNLILHAVGSLRSRLARLEEARAEKVKVREEAAAAREEAAGKRLEAKEAARKLSERLEQLEGEQAACMGRADSAQAQIMLREQREQDLRASLDDLQGRRERLKDRQNTACRRRDELQPEVADLRRQHRELSAALEAAPAAPAGTSSLAAERSEIESRLRELRTSVESRMQALLQDQVGLGVAATELERLQREGVELDSRLQSLRTAQQENDARGSAAAQAAQDLVSRIDASVHRQAELQRRSDESRRALEEVERQIAGNAAKANLISEMQSGYEGYYDSVRRLFQRLRRSPELHRQVYGTVADAIRVDSRYETALETALGSAVQNVIVTTDAAARDLIRLLREERLGRITFLPVEALQVRRLDGREQHTVREQGLLGSASDLISCDAQVRPAIDYLLARTVVAEDLDQALEVKRRHLNSFRLVTLSGDVVVPGGAITGGSSRRPQVSLLARRRMSEELAQAHRELEGRREQVRQQRRQAAAELEACQKQRGTLEAELQRAKLILAGCQGESERLGQSLREMQRRREDWTEDLRLAEAARADGDAVRAQAEAALETLRREQTEQEQALLRVDAAIENERTAGEETRRQNAELEKKLAAIEAGLEPKNAALLQAEADWNQTGDELKQLDMQLDAVQRELAENSAALAASRSSLAAARQDAERLHAQIDTEGRRLRRELENADFFEQQMNETAASENDGSRDVYRLEADIDKCQAQIGLQMDRLWQEHELTWANAENLKTDPFSPRAGQERITHIRARLRELGDVNLKAVEDYDRVSERLEELSSQREDLVAASGDLEVVIAELMAAMRTAFEERFAAINDAFSRAFQELFGGGSAKLTLEQNAPVMEAGVEISAEPPGKKLQNISLLSDGEKAMTAIALCMAMLEVNPSPICLLDEIDAPLDDKNVVRLSEYLTRLKDKLQFIVITHKKTTMSVCDTLYGVAMHEKGVTDIVSVAMD